MMEPTTPDIEVKKAQESEAEHQRRLRAAMRAGLANAQNQRVLTELAKR